MTEERVLIAGIGNIFLGDDAFGSEVARVLITRNLPPEVKVVDFGIRGFDLAFALLDDYQATIMIDATPRGGQPGTLYLIEPVFSYQNQLDSIPETHGMNPIKVLAMVKAMGGKCQNILLLGCEPAPPEDGEEKMGLSVPVQAAIPEAIRLIETLLAKVLADINSQKCNAQALSGVTRISPFHID